MITLKTLKKASKQKVFDQVATHLLTQKKKSMAGINDTCAYRGQENLKCAAGCLISDAEYLELRLWDYNSEDWALLAEIGIVPEKHSDLILSLQGIHDYGDPENWYGSLKRLAVVEELNDRVLEKFKK